MALSNDWELIIILSLYSIGLAGALTAYNSSFDSNGKFNTTGTDYSQSGNADYNTKGISFLNSLSFGLPNFGDVGVLLSFFFITIFEVLPAGALGILIFRQIRSGGG